MKKILFILFLLIPFFVYAEEDIVVESITLDSKSKDAIINEEPIIEGNSININADLFYVDDFVKYKVVIKNDTDNDYNISINDNNNEYVNYKLESNDGDIIGSKSKKEYYLTITYKKSVDKELFINNIYNSNNSIKLDLIEKEEDIVNEIINPNTSIGSYILIMIILLIISVICLIYFNKKYSVFILLLLMISIPLYVYAELSKEIVINIKINLNNGMLASEKIINLVNGYDKNSNEIINVDSLSDTCNNSLIYDESDDKKLRYVGETPCNYVLFNNELWRIVSVNDIDDGTGNSEVRLKIKRDEALDIYSWNSNDSSTGYGTNDWTNSYLMNELNGDYLNTELTENTLWYNGRHNQREAVFDYTKVLKSEAQAMIKDAKWYLGGTDLVQTGSTATVLPLEFYGYERSETPAGRQNDWVGKVGLLYPTDIYLATGSEETIQRSECLATSVHLWQDTECSKSNYFLNYETAAKRSNTWTISMFTENKRAVYVVQYTGRLNPNVASMDYLVFPTVYLKPEVLIVAGNGSIDSPYILSN